MVIVCPYMASDCPNMAIVCSYTVTNCPYKVGYTPGHLPCILSPTSVHTQAAPITAMAPLKKKRQNGITLDEFDENTPCNQNSYP